MKKLILLCLVFAFSNAFFAQTATAKKTEKTVKTEKKTTVKLKKDGTPDKRYKTETKVVLKKDGTPDKRYKENSASATGTAKSTAGKAKAATNKAEARAKRMTAAEEKEDMKETAVSRSAEKKVKDKATGTYKGKKVFTGPRGGKYYINKNGNKTYIDRNGEE
jgi:colicin import membrane protein